jgi:hypothetical protein
MLTGRSGRWPALAISMLIAGLAFSVPRAAGAQDADALRVGVVDVVRVNMTAEEADALAFALGEVLERELMVEVIAGAEVRGQLGDVPDDCVAQEACLTELARALDVDQLLALVIVRGGDRTRIHATWWGAEADELEVREPISFAEGSDDARARLALAAPALLVGATPRPAPSPDEDPGLAPDADGDEGPSITRAEPSEVDESLPSLDPAGAGAARRMSLAHWTAGALPPATLATGVGIGTSMAISCGGFGTCEMSDSRSRWRARADVLAISGGLVLGATLTHYAFFRDSHGPERRSEPRVGVAPGTRGFAVFGRF